MGVSQFLNPFLASHGCSLRPACPCSTLQAPLSERVQYVAWDLSRHAKTDSRHLLQDLQRLQAPLLRATGLFVSGVGGSAGPAPPTASGMASVAWPTGAGQNMQHSHVRGSAVLIVWLHAPPCCRVAPARRAAHQLHRLPGQVGCELGAAAVARMASLRPATLLRYLSYPILPWPHPTLLCRTNISQFAFGLLALGLQLHALGISEGERAMHSSVTPRCA